MINIKKSLITLFFVLFLVGVAGCNNENSGLPAQHGNGSISGGGDTGGGSIEVTLVSLAVTPKPFDLANGLTKQLTAIATYSDDSTKNVTNEATWSSSSDLIATVTNIGLVTAKSSTGTATITAVFDSVLSETQVTTIGPELASLEIAPSNTTVSMAQLTDPANSKVNYTATALYSDGSSKPATELVTWESDNTSLATVLSKKGASSGLATPIAAGNLNIKATLVESGITQSASSSLTVTASTLVSITVSPKKFLLPSEVKVPVKATAQYSDGSTKDVTNDTNWVVTSTELFTLKPEAGSEMPIVVIGAKNGVVFCNEFDGDDDLNNKTIITANYQSMTDTAELTVIGSTLQLPLTTSFPNNELEVGLTSQFTATAVLGGGDIFVSKDVSYVPTEEDFLGWYGALSKDIPNATPNLNEDVVQDPDSTTSVDISDYEDWGWSSSDEDVVDIGKTTGLATFKKSGTSIISFQWGRNPDSDYAPYSVERKITILASSDKSPELEESSSVEPAVTSISISGNLNSNNTLALAKGTLGQLIAEATFSDGSIRNITEEADWTTSDSGVLSVSSSGLITANAIIDLNADISASFKGHVRTVAIQVNNAVLEGAVVSVDKPNLAIGDSAQLTVIATFNSAGSISTQNITSSTTLFSVNPEIAVITNYGEIQALSTDSIIIGFGYGTDYETNSTGNANYYTGIAFGYDYGYDIYFSDSVVITVTNP